MEAISASKLTIIELEKRHLEIFKVIYKCFKSEISEAIFDPICIIHFIRDPRFQVRSGSKLSSFKCESGVIPGYCRSVEDDITLGSQLSPALYRLVRCEDLTRDPLTVLTALYQFIGVDMTGTISDRIKLHFHAENRFYRHAVSTPCGHHPPDVHPDSRRGDSGLDTEGDPVEDQTVQHHHESDLPSILLLCPGFLGCWPGTLHQLGKGIYSFMLGILVDFSIKWVGGVPLVH